jgi:hypothetical protein
LPTIFPRGCPDIAEILSCLFVCLFVYFTLSSSTLRGLVKNLMVMKNKDMNINII